MIDKRRKTLIAWTVLAILWLLAIAIATSQVFVSKVITFPFLGNNFTMCNEDWKDINHSKIYTVFLFVATFLIPLLLMGLFYGIIVYKISHDPNERNLRVVNDYYRHVRRVKVRARLSSDSNDSSHNF